MQTWITTTGAQWQAAFNRDVTDRHAAELKKLGQHYAGLLEAAVIKTSSAGNLDGVVALRNEQKRYAESNFFPDQDDAGDPVSVKQLRAAIRTQRAILEKENVARTRALYAKYDQFLAATQSQLTQRRRIEDALLVQKTRREISVTWLAGLPVETVGLPTAKPATRIEKPRQPVESVPNRQADKNLLTNGNFAQETEGWVFNSFGQKGQMTLDRMELHNGNPSVRIENGEDDDSSLKQKVEVKPGTWYRLSGWIKTKGVGPQKGNGPGATLSRGGFLMSQPIVKTKGWTSVSVNFVTQNETQIEVGPRLGQHAGGVVGTAWYSEVVLTELPGPPKKK